MDKTSLEGNNGPMILQKIVVFVLSFVFVFGIVVLLNCAIISKYNGYIFIRDFVYFLMSGIFCKFYVFPHASSNKSKDISDNSTTLSFILGFIGTALLSKIIMTIVELQFYNEYLYSQLFFWEYLLLVFPSMIPYIVVDYYFKSN